MGARVYWLPKGHARALLTLRPVPAVACIMPAGKAVTFDASGARCVACDNGCKDASCRSCGEHTCETARPPVTATYPELAVTGEELHEESPVIRFMAHDHGAVLPYRLANVYPAGDVCWGNDEDPLTLREAWLRFWSQGSNEDLWSKPVHGQNCPEPGEIEHKCHDEECYCPVDHECESSHKHSHDPDDGDCRPVCEKRPGHGEGGHTPRLRAFLAFTTQTDSDGTTFYVPAETYRNAGDVGCRESGPVQRWYSLSRMEAAGVYCHAEYAAGGVCRCCEAAASDGGISCTCSTDCVCCHSTCDCHVRRTCPCRVTPEDCGCERRACRCENGGCDCLPSGCGCDKTNEFRQHLESYDPWDAEDENNQVRGSTLAKMFPTGSWETSDAEAVLILSGAEASRVPADWRVELPAGGGPFALAFGKRSGKLWTAWRDAETLRNGPVSVDMTPAPLPPRILERPLRPLLPEGEARLAPRGPYRDHYSTHYRFPGEHESLPYGTVRMYAERLRQDIVMLPDGTWFYWCGPGNSMADQVAAWTWPIAPAPPVTTPAATAVPYPAATETADEPLAF